MRRMRRGRIRKGRVLAIGMASGLLACLVAASSASAAPPYYVSPTGTGTTCSQASRCSLNYAGSVANLGEDVILADGTYDLTADLFTSGNLVPEVAGTRPVVRSTTGKVVVTFVTVLIRDIRFELSNLGPSSYGLNMQAGGTAERVEVIASGSGGSGTTGMVLKQSAVLADSVVTASGTNSAAVVAGLPGATVRNVTAIASGSGSVGFFSGTGFFGSDGTVTVNVQNSIVRGEQRSFDLEGNATKHVVVNVDHGNYTTPNLVLGSGDSLNDLGGAQSASPLFTSATDFHQLAGSPTVNAGASVAGLSATDLDGQSRTQGGAPDIGADELVPSAPGGPGGPSAPTKKKCKKPKKRSAASAKKCKKKRKRK